MEGWSVEVGGVNQECLHGIACCRIATFGVYHWTERERERERREGDRTVQLVIMVFSPIRSAFSMSACWSTYT